MNIHSATKLCLTCQAKIKQIGMTFINRNNNSYQSNKKDTNRPQNDIDQKIGFQGVDIEYEYAFIILRKWPVHWFYRAAGPSADRLRPRAWEHLLYFP
jgi:hypothetical protein